MGLRRSRMRSLMAGAGSVMDLSGTGLMPRRQQLSRSVAVAELAKTPDRLTPPQRAIVASALLGHLVSLHRELDTRGWIDLLNIRLLRRRMFLDEGFFPWAGLLLGDLPLPVTWVSFGRSRRRWIRPIAQTSGLLDTGLGVGGVYEFWLADGPGFNERRQFRVLLDLSSFECTVEGVFGAVPTSLIDELEDALHLTREGDLVSLSEMHVSLRRLISPSRSAILTDYVETVIAYARVTASLWRVNVRVDA